MWGKRRNTRPCQRDPVTQTGIDFETQRSHRDEPAHVPSSEHRGSRVGSRKRIGIKVGSGPHNQGLTDDRHKHVASDHERQPTEHPPFGHVSVTSQNVP